MDASSATETWSSKCSIRSGSSWRLTNAHLNGGCNGKVGLVMGTAYRVHEYGCLAPVSGEALALDEMRRRILLWNSLVEIEREYRARSQELLTIPELDPQIKSMSDQIGALRSEIKNRRSKERRRTGVDISDLQGRIKVLRETRKAFAIAAKRKRRAIVEQRRTALAILERERHDRVKQACATSGLYWGNYDDVVHNYETARIRALKKGGELRRQDWHGAGKLSVRYQTGLPIEKLYSDTRFQIDPVDPRAWQAPERSVRRRLARTRARLRVASNADHSPVWLEVPVVIHRPLTDRAVIRSVHIRRDVIGPQIRHRLLVTVSEPVRVAPDVEARPWVAVHTGWRLRPGGIRVACWIDTLGQGGELLLEEVVVKEFRKISELQSILQQQWNEVEAALALWLSRPGVPEWVQNQFDPANHPLTQKRAHDLFYRWRNERFEGDEEMFSRMAAWERRYLHLHNWKINLWDQAPRRRREIYRLYAVKIAKTYGQVFVDDFSIARIARKPAAEIESTEWFGGRLRMIAAPGQLRLIISRTCEREGVFVRPMGVSEEARVCPSCAAVYAGQTDYMILHCEHCGRDWDQDHQRASQMLGRGRSP